MANPAQLLFDLLSSWAPQGGQSATQLRNLDTLEDDVLKAHRRAMGLIGQIEEVLDGLASAGRRVTQYQQQIPKWHRMVLAYPEGWGVQQPAYDGTAMALLETLSDVFDGVLPVTTEAQRQGVEELCGRVLKLLAEDDSLPADLKRHLTAVVNHCRACVAEFSVVGDFDLRVAVDRLVVAVTAATRASTSKQSEWAETLKGWAYPFSIALSAAIANDAVQLAIGGH